MYIYHTNACCNPEYAIKGMINSMRTSSKGVITDFDSDVREEYKLTEESLGPSSPPSTLLLKKHTNMVPKVILQRNTVNNKVVPVVLPSCNMCKKMRSEEMYQVHICMT
jgi:hypothetical protein